MSWLLMIRALALQLMQQLMSSNRQRQLQARAPLLPLAHRRMFRDEAAQRNGAVHAELKVCPTQLCIQSACTLTRAKGQGRIPRHCCTSRASGRRLLCLESVCGSASGALSSSAVGHVILQQRRMHTVTTQRVAHVVGTMWSPCTTSASGALSSSAVGYVILQQRRMHTVITQRVAHVVDTMWSHCPVVG